MNRSVPLFALGGVLVVAGAALFALTLRKPDTKPVVNPNKSQLRDQATAAEEAKKMRIGAGILAGIGFVLIAIS
jgi:uncharacterized membrane protein YhiD involved in acid resistance